MTDGTQQRPNAKYKLSKPDNLKPSKEELVFYYNRDHRLSKASQDVQDLYKEKKANYLGFLTVLVADRPRKILFLSIILICVMIWLLGLLGYFDKSISIDGNKLVISITAFEDTAIVKINKTIKNKKAYTGAVDLAVSVPLLSQGDTTLQTESNFPVFYHRIFFSLEKEEQYSFAVPFESGELLFVLQTEKNTLKLKLPVQ
jgi:4-amino-4-deoxy-L-arabinose transferase-like glycosyltransferase